MNPARVTDLINKTISLFTSAVSYSRLTAEAIRAVRLGWVLESNFVLIFMASIVLCLGILFALLGAALSIGNARLKRLACKFAFSGGVAQILGLVGIYLSFLRLGESANLERVVPQLPMGFAAYLAIALATVLASTFLLALIPRPDQDMPYEMERSKQLVLMYLPFAALVFVFSYLPLWGWRYAFFDYRAGVTALTAENFVGLKWFAFLFQNQATLNDIVRVMRNTLIMSTLGLTTSWLPMVFAMFLVEAKSVWFKRFVQTFTTIPNFISWVLVYGLALALFSTDGFVNSLLLNLGVRTQPLNYLMGDSFIWLKMWAWGTWKGLGWSSIIYIATISSIDPTLYESATVDGAGRFQKMRYITLPSLMPTYFVLLIMAVAAFLSNGMEQYLVFENSTNTAKITVLDLYVYQLGIKNGVIPLSTLIGMVKSLISVVLLFSVNRLSKMVRDESIF
ncbi:MAG TPA: sugar ABC transporter permease [Firmicutes bacterium]|nr:sugar ABC transporter permease [Bacillota bacterium]